MIPPKQRGSCRKAKNVHATWLGTSADVPVGLTNARDSDRRNPGRCSVVSGCSVAAGAAAASTLLSLSSESRTGFRSGGVVVILRSDV